VIPDSEKRTSAITVDRQALRDALKRVEALTASKGQGARLTCRGPALSITAVAVDVGEFEEELACELTGKAQAVGVNVSFLLESVETFEEERVTLHVIDALAPLVVVGAEDQGRELQAVVMPMRM
jgi:DNA polymerase III sliding clamp (beta) subunit (PCNA family)